jgi:hypothetical protein
VIQKGPSRAAVLALHAAGSGAVSQGAIASTIKTPAESPGLTWSIISSSGGGREDDDYSVMTTTFVPKAGL